MKERKFVKLRIDMYEDTKFKIIDTKPERDLIHYIWTRLLTLAGKVNLAGELYLSKNIPYTVETLGIEFNRSAMEVKLALKILEDLEMVEFTADNVYKIKNFAKHQNIRVEEKSNTVKNEVKIENEEEVIKNLENQAPKYENKKSEKPICPNKEKKLEKAKVNNKSENKKTNNTSIKVKNEIISNEPANINISKIKDSSIETKNQIAKEKIIGIGNHDSKKLNTEPSPVSISPPKNRGKGNKADKASAKNKKGINDIEMMEEENSLINIYDGFDAIPFVEGDEVVASWSYCN